MFCHIVLIIISSSPHFKILPFLHSYCFAIPIDAHRVRRQAGKFNTVPIRENSVERLTTAASRNAEKRRRERDESREQRPIGSRRAQLRYASTPKRSATSEPRTVGGSCSPRESRERRVTERTDFYSVCPRPSVKQTSPTLLCPYFHRFRPSSHIECLFHSAWRTS